MLVRILSESIEENNLLIKIFENNQFIFEQIFIDNLNFFVLQYIDFITLENDLQDCLLWEEFNF